MKNTINMQSFKEQKKLISSQFNKMIRIIRQNYNFITNRINTISCRYAYMKIYDRTSTAFL